VEHRGENPDRGSGEPVESEPDAEAAGRAPLDEELLGRGSGLPLTDALDTGDPGAPDAALGGGDDAPVTARQSAAGSGVRVGELRDRGSDYERDFDEPPHGGPAPDEAA
jgi:hypothetical protein